MKPLRPDSHTLSTRASHVVLAMAIVTAVSGYFMGLHQIDRAHATPTSEARSMARSPESPSALDTPEGMSGNGGVPRIVEYSRLGEAGLKPNAAWRNSLASLRPGQGGGMSNAVLATSVPGRRDSSGGLSGATQDASGSWSTRRPASDEERRKAVQRRASRRAFDGAPPVVPHPVDATSSANCRVCHAEGLRVRDVVAPRMSHPEMGNCTQCHVPSDGGVPNAAPEWALGLAGNEFVGRASVGRGSRAWPGAPPTIPHATWMREQCSSCHGATGLPGLQTSHPERVLCTQCHVPDGGFAPGLAELAELTGSGPGTGLNSPR